LYMDLVSHRLLTMLRIHLFVREDIMRWGTIINNNSLP
jgi:hypothetical protein